MKFRVWICLHAGLGASTVSVIGAARYSRAWLGVAVALAAGAAFAIANTSASVAYEGGSNPLTVASTRFLLPTVTLLAWLGFDGASLILPKRQAIVAVLLVAGALTGHFWLLVLFLPTLSAQPATAPRPEE